MTTNYKRGAAIEYHIRKKYQDMGYFVLRSAGSHSPVDLLAMNDKELLLIQVKNRESGKISREDLLKATIELLDVPAPPEAIRLIIVWKKFHGIVDTIDVGGSV